MYVISRLNLDWVRRYTALLLIAAFVMLVLVKIPGIGVKVNGARRWLGAGPLQFQPSEIMKLALILHTAAVIGARPKIAHNLRTMAGPVIGVAAAAIGLIALQPDLGTALVISATIGAMLVAAGLPHAPARPAGGRGRHARDAVRRRRAVPARAPHRLPEPVGTTPPEPAFSPIRARSRSGPAGSSGAGSASRSRRSSTFPRPTPTSSSPSSARNSAWRGSSDCCRCTA